MPCLLSEPRGCLIRAVRPVMMGPTPSAENPPSAKQTVSKMLIIKKVSREEPSAAFSACFASTAPFPVNGSKAPGATQSVYKTLVPKPAAAPSKVRAARVHMDVADTAVIELKPALL